MKRLIALVLLLFGSTFAVPILSHPVNGVFTGLVCIVPATATQCLTPYTVGNVAVGSTFVVGVFVSKSEAMGGFDIYVSVNPTYLHPNSAALGPLIASPSLTSICINGSPQTGSCTIGAANGPGVVEATTADSSGFNECGGLPPCSGLAFTINYTVVGNTAGTPISYPTSTGCSTSSIASPPNVCVLVSDASGGTLTETDQPASFASLDPTANFFATPTTGASPLHVAFDASFSAPTRTHTINNYTWTFGDGNITKLTGSTLSPTVSHIYYSTGTYNPSLQTTDNSGNVSAIVDSVIITVLKDNFTISVNPNNLIIRTGGNRNSSITLTSFNGTAGPINLSNNGTSAPLGLSVNWTSLAPILTPGQTLSKGLGLMLSASNSAPSGTFNITVTATYTFNTSKISQTTIRASASIKIQVIGFNYRLSNPGELDVPRGSSGNETITLTLIGKVPGQPVTLSISPINPLPTGVSVIFSPPKVTPTNATQTSTGNSTTLIVRTSLSTPLGGHLITVTGSPLGATTNATTFTLFITDFTITASPTTVSIPQGGNGNSVITVQGGGSGAGGFVGAITLTARSLSTNLVAVINTTSFVLPSGIGQPTVFIIVKASTAPGTYQVNVTGSFGPLVHSAIVTITVPTPDYTATSAPTSVSVTAGSSGTSVISIIGLNGFAGTVTLSANSSSTLGISTTLSATLVTITFNGGPQGSTLTISTLATTPAGTYAINITATSPGIGPRYATVTLVVNAAQSSVSLAGATLSSQSAQAGKSVAMTVTLSDTGAAPVNVTITMDVNSGSGSNITVAQKTILLRPGQAGQTFTLSWNTTQWTGGSYKVYARVIGSQSTSVNQAMNAGSLALSSPPAQTTGVDLSVVPWVTTGIFAAIAALFAVLLFRRRSPKGNTGPA